MEACVSCPSTTVHSLATKSKSDAGNATSKKEPLAKKVSPSITISCLQDVILSGTVNPNSTEKKASITTPSSISSLLKNDGATKLAGLSNSADIDSVVLVVDKSIDTTTSRSGGGN